VTWLLVRIMDVHCAVYVAGSKYSLAEHSGH
jgi:hypothetical protein